jgi:putative addiction module killer protein
MEVRQTPAFSGWMARLRDHCARANIAARIDCLALGNPGDVAPVGEGVGELRIQHGPSYRVYFIKRDQRLIVMLCGDDKSTQTKDIKATKILAAKFED